MLFKLDWDPGTGRGNQGLSSISLVSDKLVPKPSKVSDSSPRGGPQAQPIPAFHSSLFPTHLCFLITPIRFQPFSPLGKWRAHVSFVGWSREGWPVTGVLSS